ncbi:butyrophilin subfamily 2 member A2-like [Clarias gariepinus]|uniref:butyrophilin subfamily 2 member A2-like n=1 Tax=Clarias gariepinus TaxID=13013 RepID=UPI00234DFB39|nr:butyrophilin subfamily 2 member A2-like [Clarias gariepinus]
MTSALPLRWVLLIFILAVIHQASSEYFSLKVESPVSGLLGSSVSLHCAVTNNMDVRPMEVRWYRPNMYDTPALFYKDAQIQKSPVDVQYQGRVFLLGDLEKGDVSVKLENLTLTDRGDYVCYVASATWYEKATVSLRLRVVGSTPVLSIREAGEGKVNVSCQSHGWVPEPSITWTDEDGRDLSNNKFTINSVGTVDVSSWLIVSPSESEWISCSVGLSDQERKEDRIMVHVPARDTESLTGYIIIIITVLLVLCVESFLSAVGLILSRRKRTDRTGAGTQSETEPLNKIRVENQDPTDAPSTDIDQNSEQSAKIPPTAPPTETEPAAPITNTTPAAPTTNTTPDANHRPTGPVSENSYMCVRAEVSQQESSEHQNPETLEDKTHLPETGPADSTSDNRPTLTTSEISYNLDQVKQYKVNISIDPEETPESLIYEGKEVRSSAVYPHLDINNPDEFKIFTLCKERFQAGKHYWEVKLRESQKTVKFSWFVGVVSDEAEKEYSVQFTPQDGFWVLCYERGDKGVYIRDQTEVISLPDVNKELTAVGVFLDCDTHTLSFYNINTHSHIYTFTNVDVRTSLRPLISPGVRDSHPVWII